VSTIAYLLAVDIDRQRLFWFTIAGIGILIPPITVQFDLWLLADYWNVTTPTTTAAGLSVIVSAITGMLIVLIGLAVSVEYGRNWGIISGWLVLAAGGLLSLRFIFLVAVAVIILGGVWILQVTRPSSVVSSVEPPSLLVSSGSILSIAFLGSLLTYRASAGVLTNVFAHAAAFTTGFVWSLLATWIDTNLLES